MMSVAAPENNARVGLAPPPVRRAVEREPMTEVRGRTAGGSPAEQSPGGGSGPQGLYPLKLMAFYARLGF